MIDITRESVISLADAARKLGVHIRTARQWAARQHTTNKPRLETAKAGGKRITTLEAIQRFLTQETREVAVDPQLSRISATSLARHREAERRALEVHGIKLG